RGIFESKDQVKVVDGDGNTQEQLNAKHFIIATGARPRELPNIEIDGKLVIDSERAMQLEDQPEKLVVIGAGAIGVEFAYFYNIIGTEVTIVELQDSLVPVEDKDVGKELGKIYKKKGINIKTGSTVEKVEKKGKGV